jgi:hypothetical protein
VPLKRHPAMEHPQWFVDRPIVIVIDKHIEGKMTIRRREWEKREKIKNIYCF